MSQYCVCSVNCGEDGTLYYKNDSGFIFAVTAGSTSFIVRVINIILAWLSKLFGGTKR